MAIVYLPEEQLDADDTRRMVEETGRRCLPLPGDLKDAAVCQGVVARTVAEFGRLNILVGNAACLNSKLELEQLTAQDWDRTFKTNAYAHFPLVMAALPHLDPGDAVIATATEEALKGSTNRRWADDRPGHPSVFRVKVMTCRSSWGYTDYFISPVWRP
ncbi:SDR family oxidoreductase [Streptomyces flavofungini]|uniref:SDR family oxidoreductase n=1 Tax=Streptomyces flavofungini TaxID=68200 RepID=UPI0025B18710|nr:SDR family oxidoreductase [Streptomyces flavofungini]WJV50551.1 SDR family oxidoreductase [Streptomyces flavofungini]